MNNIDEKVRVECYGSILTKTRIELTEKGYRVTETLFKE